MEDGLVTRPPMVRFKYALAGSFFVIMVATIFLIIGFLYASIAVESPNTKYVDATFSYEINARHWAVNYVATNDNDEITLCVDTPLWVGRQEIVDRNAIPISYRTSDPCQRAYLSHNPFKLRATVMIIIGGVLVVIGVLNVLVVGLYEFVYKESTTPITYIGIEPLYQSGGIAAELDLNDAKRRSIGAGGVGDSDEDSVQSTPRTSYAEDPAHHREFLDLIQRAEEGGYFSLSSSSSPD